MEAKKIIEYYGLKGADLSDTERLKKMGMTDEQIETVRASVTPAKPDEKKLTGEQKRIIEFYGLKGLDWKSEVVLADKKVKDADIAVLLGQPITQAESKEEDVAGETVQTLTAKILSINPEAKIHPQAGVKKLQEMLNSLIGMDNGESKEEDEVA